MTMVLSLAGGSAIGLSATDAYGQGPLAGDTGKDPQVGIVPKVWPQ
jgi:hypothetical protein